MFCQKCGNEIRNNDVCSCVIVSVESNQTIENEPNDAQNKTQTVMENAAKIAADFQKNPYVADVINVVKGMLSKDIMNTLENAGKRSDILWIILICVTALISTVSIFFGLFNWLLKMVNSLASSMWFGSSKLRLGDILDFSDVLLINISILASLIASFFIFSGLLFLLTIVCKKKVPFYRLCNMLSFAFIPATVLTFFAFIFTAFLPAISLFLLVAAFSSMPVLIYSGIKTLEELEQFSFWVFCAYYTISLSVSAYIVSRFVFGAITNLYDLGLDRLIYSLF